MHALEHCVPCTAIACKHGDPDHSETEVCTQGTRCLFDRFGSTRYIFTCQTIYEPTLLSGNVRYNPQIDSLGIQISGIDEDETGPNIRYLEINIFAYGCRLIVSSLESVSAEIEGNTFNVNFSTLWDGSSISHVQVRVLDADENPSNYLYLEPQSTLIVQHNEQCDPTQALNRCADGVCDLVDPNETEHEYRCLYEDELRYECPEDFIVFDIVEEQNEYSLNTYLDSLNVNRLPNSIYGTCGGSRFRMVIYRLTASIDGTYSFLIQSPDQHISYLKTSCASLNPRFEEDCSFADYYNRFGYISSVSVDLEEGQEIYLFIDQEDILNSQNHQLLVYRPTSDDE